MNETAPTRGPGGTAQGGGLLGAQDGGRAGTDHRPAGGRVRWGRFAWHYVEMIIAMFVGMFVLGMLLRAAGLGFSHDRQPELAYLLMAFDMSVGMAVWMRYRGHGWIPTLEMCAAMFVPVVPLFPLLWAGVIDSGGLMTLAHVAMFPLMLVAMLWRRDEYAACGD